MIHAKTDLQFSSFFSTFKLVFAAGLMTGSVMAHAQSFTFDELKNTVQSHQINNLDNLIPLLPTELKNNVMLIYNSHALDSQRATMAEPRMVFTNRDGSLAFAVLANPGADDIAAGKDFLEYIRFDSATDKFVMGAAKFAGTSDPFAEINHEINPQRCLACHGENPRPMLQSYNAWPGFYGSFGFEGVMTADSKEIAGFKSFLATRMQLPRYKDLNLAAFQEFDPSRPNGQRFTPLQTDDVAHIKNFSGDYVMKENRDGKDSHGAGVVAAFGQNINLLMFKRAARLFMEHPDYKKIEPLLAHLGAPNDKTLCGPVRDRNQQLILSIKQKMSADQVADLDHKIQALVQKLTAAAVYDEQEKEKEFFTFNLTDTNFDTRGVVNLTSSNLLGGTYDPFYSTNPESFRLQMVILESILQKLKMDASVVSTHFVFPTTGIFHIPFENLYDDEQYFQGLVRELIQRDPDYSKRNYDNGQCAWRYDAVIDAMNFVGIGSADQGVLIR